MDDEKIVEEKSSWSENACESARHIFVDKSGPKKIQETYAKAREILKEGTSW